MTPGLWRLNPACRLHWRHWQEGHLVFNAASGQTHYLNDAAAAVLELSSDSPVDAFTIGRFFQEQPVREIDEELLNYSHTILLDLESLGLLESVFHDRQ